MIRGERVRQAREFRALTQTALAAAAGVNQSAIAHIEAGRSQPTREVFQAISGATGFPLEFFEAPPISEFPVGSLMFRARASMTARERMQAHRHGQALYEFLAKLMERVTPMPVTLSEFSHLDAEGAARSARTALGLSALEPIRHLTRALEMAGVWMLAVPLSFPKHDAFSTWVQSENDRPVIVFSSGSPGDRLRFSLAHELGHITMHRRPSVSTTQLEHDANRFAAEFLVPNLALRKEVASPVTLTSLSALKTRWGVSIQMLVRRAYDCSVISKRQYRYMFEQISRLGWRTEEPPKLGVPTEKPRLARQALELIYGVPLDCYRIAAEANLPPSFVEAFVAAQSDGQGT